MLEEQAISETTAEQDPADQLLEDENDHRFELIDGKLVERNMGARADQIASKIMKLVALHLGLQKPGKVFGAATGYQIFAEGAKKVRFPDGSYIAPGRFADEQTPPGHIRIPPDLAIEVISPHDNAEGIEAKRIEFLRAGTRLWWVIYPKSRTVHVYRDLHHCTVYTDDQEITDDEVLPGFRCPVRAFFED